MFTTLSAVDQLSNAVSVSIRRFDGRAVEVFKNGAMHVLKLSQEMFAFELDAAERMLVVYVSLVDELLVCEKLLANLLYTFSCRSTASIFLCPAATQIFHSSWFSFWESALASKSCQQTRFTLAPSSLKE